MITLSRRAAQARIEAKLEREYEGHTERLAVLLEHRRRRTSSEVEAAAADARAAIADTALALRRMAEGRYGTCEGCSGDIEADVLEARPAARYCRACTTSVA